MSRPDEGAAVEPQDREAPPGMRRVDRPASGGEAGPDDRADEDGDAGLPPEGDDPMEGPAPSG